MAECSVVACSKPPRKPGMKLCSMHYMRLHRHGSLERVRNGSGIGTPTTKYRTVWAKGHVLANPSGTAWEHRVVLYDTLGGSDPACHHCGMQLRWAAARFDHDAVQVDHLNRLRDDNRPENLVPSCRVCNNRRAGITRHLALVEAGFWSGPGGSQRGQSRPPEGGEPR